MFEELESFGLFASLSPEVFASLRSEIALLGVPGGHLLLRKGEEADALYLVLRGRLRTTADDGRVLGEINAGGYVGEMALLTGAPRSANVLAVRDSTLARLSRRGFEKMVAACPEAALAMARTIAARAQSNVSRGNATDPFSTVCLLTDDNDEAAREFERVFLRELAGVGATVDVGAESLPHREGERATDPADRDHDEACAWQPADGAMRQPMHAEDAAWFDTLENTTRFVVYRCHPGSPDWTQLCLRRADLVLIVIRPDEIGSLGAAVAAAPASNLAGIDIVLLHDGCSAATVTAPMRAAATFRHVHHVRRGQAGDTARTVRLLTGRATGLALSGGNRRGAAHLGTLRALQEAGIAIDLVAGTSAGAIVGAMAALEFDWRDALQDVHRLGRMTAWRDVGPPIVALLSGRSLSRTLQAIFGDALVDGTPIPFLPVCSAVESGEVFVPDRGPLWLALRASASLPGIFPPVPWQARLLMDGALVNNLPADLLRLRCPAGRVIASDVGMPNLRTDFPPDLHSTSGWKLLLSRWRGGGGAVARSNLVDLLTGAACAASTRHLAAIRAGIDCYIAPPIDDHATMSRRNGHDINVLVERGYEAACRALDRQG